MVEQLVEDGDGHHGITEHLAPFADCTLRCDQQVAAVVVLRDQLEEPVDSLWFER